MNDVVVNTVVRANARQLVQEIARSRAEFKGFGSDAQIQGKRAQAGLSQAGQGADVARRQIELAKTALIGFFSIQAAARGLADLRARADGYANLTAKIKLASDGQAQYVAAEAEVFAISQRTSAQLGATAQLYSRLYQALKDQGAGQREVLGLTETINQAFAVSGATAGEAAGAIQQLSQATAAGALRGDEFNSVNEQAPRLMQALADSLGVTRGALRAMAEEGQLTSDKLREALSGDQAAKIAEEFSQLPLTIERSFLQLDNAFTRYIGRASEASGAGSLIAVSVQGVADNFQALANVAGVLAAVLAGRLAASLAASVQGLVLKRAATVAMLEMEAAAAVAAKASAVANVRAAKADVDRARTLQLTGAAAGQVAAAEAALVVATNADAAATARATVAKRALATATSAAGFAVRGLSAALALVGGPLGLAIAGFAILATRMASASAEARQLKQDVTAAMDAAQRARDAEDLQQLSDSTKDLLKQREALRKETARQQALRSNVGVAYFDNDGLKTGKTLDADIAAKQASIAQLTTDIEKNNRAMTELSNANASGSRTTRQVAKDSAELSKELAKQTEQSRLSTIETTQGYRARLIAQAIVADGVKSEKDLSAARIQQIDAAAKQKAAEDAASASKKAGAKASRDAAGEAKKHAEEVKKLAEAQREFRDATAQLEADNRGPIAGAAERTAQAVAGARREGSGAGVSDAEIRARVAAITAGATAEVQRMIADGRIALLEGTGQTVEAATLRATQQYQQTIDNLIATGNTAGAEVFKQLFNVDVAKAQLAQLQQQVDLAFSDLQRRQQSLQTQVQTGAITEYEARQQLIDLYREHGATVDELLPKMEALALATGDPQAIERVRQIRAELEQLNSTTSLFQQEAGQTFTGAFSSALEGLITRTQTLREAFAGFFADMAAGFARMAAQALAQAAWAKILKAFGVESGDTVSAGAEKLDQAAIKTTMAGFSILAGATALTAAAAALAAAGGLGGAGGGGEGGIGGVLGALVQGGLGAFGFDDGGYTGPGGKRQLAGFVHKHEYVHPQEAVNYYGLDFMRAIHMRQLPRFAVNRVAAPSPRFSFADGGHATGVLPIGGGNRLSVYNYFDLDALAQRLSRHPVMEKAYVAVASENGQSIQAEW